MAYPNTCFENLIGINEICEPKVGEYYLDQIPGLDLAKLAEVAESNTVTGENLAKKIIQSASSVMAADVEGIYDSQYKVQNTLVTGCSTCSFLSSYSAGEKRGIMIKNNIDSSFSWLILDKVTTMINSTGTFTIVADDGVAPKEYEMEFEAGVEYEIKLLYKTNRKSIKVYFKEPEVEVPLLSCTKSKSGCGCSGSAAVVADLIYTGLTAGNETQTAYGFIACAYIGCEASDLLCYVATSAPRMMGLALLYKSAELYFAHRINSLRNNRTVGMNVEDLKEEMNKYHNMYKDKLDGKAGSRGIKDLVYTTLQQTKDVCIVCNSLNRTGWATG